MVCPMILNLNQMQNHIIGNLFLFHTYMNSRSNKNSINLRLSRSKPANHALAPTNLTIWVITSLVTGLCHTKESWGHLSPRSSKNSQIIASVHQHDLLISWYVVKALWASCPINCLNFQKRQIWLERRAPIFFWYYQTCDRTWSIAGPPGLQCSVLNIYWCIQATNWHSCIPKGQARCFLFTKDEQRPTELHHNWERNTFRSGNSQGVP